MTLFSSDDEYMRIVGDAYLTSHTWENLRNANPPPPPRKFKPHQMTELEVERFNRAGLLRWT